MSRNYRVRYMVAAIAVTQVLGGCASTVLVSDVTRDTDTDRIQANHSSRVFEAQTSIAEADQLPMDTSTGVQSSTEHPVPAIPPLSNPALTVKPLTIDRARKTGNLQDGQLNEISGLSASNKYPGLLYAINDSGNQPVLYAINETGQLLDQWRINVKNRDWEDMTRISLPGNDYLVVGDTGDNLRVHKSASLHFLSEPAIPANTDTLNPSHTIRFRYEDGPRNVEAFAAIGQTLYLLSKEPVSVAGPSPSGVYRLELPESLNELSENDVLIATRIGSLPLRTGGLESRLAAALAGVDLSHPTALAFNVAGNTAYILTYREVLQVRRKDKQSWADAFAQRAERVFSHSLAQAEALTLAAGRAIWFTSENAGAPLWAIPIETPL